MLKYEYFTCCRRMKLLCFCAYRNPTNNALWVTSVSILLLYCYCHVIYCFATGHKNVGKKNPTRIGMFQQYKINGSQ
jgi:hypothetical protein